MKKYENEDNLMLPELLSVRTIKNDIHDRRDLKNLYKSINRFMKHGAEEKIELASGIKMTSYQRNELRIGIIRGKAILRNQINRMKTELDDLNIDYENKSNRYVKFRFTNDEINRLERKKESLRNIDTRDKQSLENLIKRINLYSSFSKMRSKNEIYKENYLKALDENFKYVEGLEELKEHLRNIDADDFYGIIAYDDLASDIKFIYKANEDIKAGQEDYTQDDVFNRIANAWYRHI